MAVTTSRPRPVSTVPGHMSAALVGLLPGYGLSVVAGALGIKPRSGRDRSGTPCDQLAAPRGHDRGGRLSFIFSALFVLTGRRPVLAWGSQSAGYRRPRPGPWRRLKAGSSCSVTSRDPARVPGPLPVSLEMKRLGSGPAGTRATNGRFPLRRRTGSEERTAIMGCEVSWFAALCDDDYEFLGVPEPALQSSWEHCRTIALAAEAGGYDNLLLPSGYTMGIDSVGFAAGIAPLLRRMQLLVAVRMGEMWAPQLARQLATLDQMLGGRLTVNIISSDLPGQRLDSGPRYQRTLETMRVLRDLLDGKPVDFHGEFVDLTLDPPRLRPKGGCPPFYFGGLSEPAREVAAQAADVFLMWPDTLPGVKKVIGDMRARAARYGRDLRFGYRAHVIVRSTEAEARAAARRLLSRLDAETGEQIRRRSLDTSSVGNARQRELREEANHEGYAEPQLWTGIGRARSGAGAAIVGDPDQVLAKLREYQQLGMDSFILSGYPHVAEGDLFARHVLPRLDHAPLFVR